MMMTRTSDSKSQLREPCDTRGESVETSLSEIAGDVPAQSEGSIKPRYQIGAVAERTALSISTLRHWDEAGLVSPSGRSDGGFRLYSEADIQRILVIRRMKPIGFTLEQMQQLLDAKDVLQSSQSGLADRAAARAALQSFAQQTQQSLDKIRRHLSYGREFAGLLDDLIRATEVD